MTDEAPVTPAKKRRLSSFPFMWNPVAFYALAFGFMWLVLSFQANGLELGEAEWTIINILIGGLNVAAGMVVQAYTKGSKTPKE